MANPSKKEQNHSRRGVKKADALQKLDESVTLIRKATKGEILLQIKCAQMESADVLMSKVLGNQAKVLKS